MFAKQELGNYVNLKKLELKDIKQVCGCFCGFIYVLYEQEMFLDVIL
jgi:hypothetical protein